MLLLNKVSVNVKDTKMNESNLAIVFTSVLFRTHSLELANAIHIATQSMITYAPQLFDDVRFTA
jgi:hypothetical protein